MAYHRVSSCHVFVMRGRGDVRMLPWQKRLRRMLAQGPGEMIVGTGGGCSIGSDVGTWRGMCRAVLVTCGQRSCHSPSIFDLQVIEPPEAAEEEFLQLTTRQRAQIMLRLAEQSAFRVCVHHPMHDMVGLAQEMTELFQRDRVTGLRERWQMVGLSALAVLEDFNDLHGVQLLEDAPVEVDEVC